MSWLSLRNNQLKFKTLGKLPSFKKNLLNMPQINKENQKMSTYNHLDLQTQGSRRIMVKNLPEHYHVENLNMYD